MCKVKTYILIVSSIFPKTHIRAGEQTLFKEKILKFEKIHTIRSNKELWKKRIDEVNQGKALLSIRTWNGAPYKSPQIEIKQLTKDDGIGYEEVIFTRNDLHMPIINGLQDNIRNQLSYNDGLTQEDFVDWFKGYDLSKSLLIIHFTDFKYRIK